MITRPCFVGNLPTDPAKTTAGLEEAVAAADITKGIAPDMSTPAVKPASNLRALFMMHPPLQDPEELLLRDLAQGRI
jgi:hypothetical protein